MWVCVLFGLKLTAASITYNLLEITLNIQQKVSAKIPHKVSSWHHVLMYSESMAWSRWPITKINVPCHYQCPSYTPLFPAHPTNHHQPSYTSALWNNWRRPCATTPPKSRPIILNALGENTSLRNLNIRYVHVYMYVCTSMHNSISSCLVYAV